MNEPLVTPESRESLPSLRLKNANVWLELSASAIRAGVRVKADTRRLFQALVAPEYVETWLFLPDVSGPLSLTAACTEHDPAWECNSLDGSGFRIRADFISSRRRRIAINWQLSRDRRQLTSNIAVQLDGAFDHSTLQLCHEGFANAEDLSWHRRLWEASLFRLANLYPCCALRGC